MRHPSRCAKGNALLETMIALFALLPFLVGIVLLGKQLDVKHKTYDALRYSLWERTVWSHDAKSDAQITLEAQDRSFGNPQARMLSASALSAEGISQNSLWRHDRRPLLSGSPSADLHEASSPVEAGYALVPALAYGDGFAATAAQVLRLDDLNLNRRAFANATISATTAPLFGEQAPLTRSASGAVLSDTWSSRNENEFRRRVDRITANELVEALELPGRPIAMQALRKGGPLYGEGQYADSPDLQPRSNALPAAYMDDREEQQ
jgi:hypothetical protein